MTAVKPPKTLLVDRRNFAEVRDQIIDQMKAATRVGIDCETHDADAHPLLKAYRAEKGKTIFDINRTTMTGFSLYPNGSEVAYYLNLAHADVENRLTHAEVLPLLDAKNPEAIWIAHKAPYEITMFRLCLGYTLVDIVCTLQMAVSCYGPDEFDFRKFQATNFDALRGLKGAITERFQSFQIGQKMDADQSHFLGIVIGKESKAAHSYNGFIQTIRYGFGLKEAIKSWFGYQMRTYADTLGGKAHMGELTGDEVSEYGAEDAFWVLPLFDKLLTRMSSQLIETFFRDENPMIHVFADCWIRGVRIDHEAVKARRALERQKFAAKLRELRAALKPFLPFPAEPNEELLRWQAYYVKACAKKRKEITDWVQLPDLDDDQAEIQRVSSSVGSGWLGKAAVKGKINLTYWQSIRVLLYDLLGAKLVLMKGEVGSDADARGLITKRFEKAGDAERVKVMNLITEMGSVEQGMKLYLTPYTALVDPDTGRVHPEITSILATRRMAMSDPNGMQLAKYGDSAYIRGFYKADQDDHIIVSADWSAIELVLIAELSGDPKMAEVYAQVPYGDLHSGTAAACLAVSHFPGLTEEEFRGFSRGENNAQRTLFNLDGVEVTPEKFFGVMRTDIGKGGNFEYYYSGLLANVAEKLGWSGEEMWEAVDRFRTLYAGAEAWRVETQERGVRDGFITLPDGHRRVRVEATDQWLREWCEKCYRALGSTNAAEVFMRVSGKRIQNRSKNQLVNALIQGLCARLAKDSILGMRQQADRRWFNFMMPIHDELVFSVHRDYAQEFIAILRRVMCNHPKYVKSIQLDATVAIGKTFRGFDVDHSPFGQIELDEATVVPGIIAPERKKQKLNYNEVADVIRYLQAA